MTGLPVKLPIVGDSTYLTIVHPYPPNTTLQLRRDRRTLALWLACCTGKPDVLRAMFYKPKAAGMVIIEVDREFERFDALLGMHSWSEFLLAPTEEDAGKSSKVFYCTYHNAEAVRDAGWNRVEFEDHWFQGWRVDNDRIKHPYPKPTYCDVPPEPKTEVPLWHRLPRRLFPITPPRQEQPITIRAFIVFFLFKAMMVIFGTALVIFGTALVTLGTALMASSVEGSATGTPHGATAGVSTSGAIPVCDQPRANDETVVEDNPWDGYDAPRRDRPTKLEQRRDDEWNCPEHGPTCFPGICTVRARFDYDERWQKLREERAEKKRKWMERKERNARKREMKPARAEGRELPHHDQLAEGNGDGSHDQGSLRIRTGSPDPPPSQEECTQTVISAEGEEFPMSADMGREHPNAEVQSSSAQVHGIGATGVGDVDGDEIVIETKIQ